MTLKELEKVTGCSRGTIDRVIHKRGNVNPETEKKIQNAIKEYGFVPNSVGKGLTLLKKNYKICSVFFKGKRFEDGLGFNDYIEYGIKHELQKLTDYGFVFEEYSIEDEFSVDTICETLNKIVETGVSAMIINLMASDRVQEAIEKIVEKGVKIVTVSTDIRGIQKFCFVGHDNYSSGRTSAQLLSHYIKRDSNILIVAGDRQFESHKSRLMGVLDYVEQDNRNMKVVDIIDFYESVQETEEKIMQTLSQNDIAAVLVLSVYSGAAISAIKKLGLENKVKVGVFDLNNQNANFLNDNKIEFIIDQSPIWQGRMALGVLGDYFLYNKLPKRYSIMSRPVIIIKENLKCYTEEVFELDEKTTL